MHTLYMNADSWEDGAADIMVTMAMTPCNEKNELHKYYYNWSRT